MYIMYQGDSVPRAMLMILLSLELPFNVVNKLLESLEALKDFIVLILVTLCHSETLYFHF